MLRFDLACVCHPTAGYAFVASDKWSPGPLPWQAPRMNDALFQYRGFVCVMWVEESGVEAVIVAVEYVATPTLAEYGDADRLSLRRAMRMVRALALVVGQSRPSATPNCSQGWVPLTGPVAWPC